MDWIGTPIDAGCDGCQVVPASVLRYASVVVSGDDRVAERPHRDYAA
jgi:hypothetical protein